MSFVITSDPSLRPADIKAVYHCDSGILVTANDGSIGSYHRLKPEAYRLYLEDLKALVERTIYG